MQIRRRRQAARNRPRQGGRLPTPLGGPADSGALSPDRVRTRAVSPAGRPGDIDTARIVEILSHELRSPITTIHLGTKVLRASGRDIPGSVRNEVVAAVEEEAERLYRLVEDLLAVARHEDGRLSLPVRPLLLQHWLPDVIDAEVHANPGLRVRFALPPELPPVLVDDGALAHVVRNLLRNASRYAADGMPVEVVARPPEDGTLAVELLDRGPGVDEAEADRLFEPFYRSESAQSFGTGAGLGLAAAQRLVSAMGGTIEAHAREGGGARFVVRLPVAKADEDHEDPGPG